MENAILKKVQNQIKNLTTLSEEIRVQMALGKAEAKDLVMREKKALTTYLNEHKAELARIENISKAKKDSFLKSVEGLEAALLSDVPTKKVDYRKYKSDVLNKIYTLEEDFRENYPLVSDKMQANLDSFKSKMDAFRLNLALHDQDQPEKVAEIKEEFTNKLDEIRTMLSKQKNDDTMVDGFLEDVSASFQFLRKAIDDLT